MTAELDALGDDFAEEEQGIPSYLREDATSELPDFVDEPQMQQEVRFEPWCTRSTCLRRPYNADSCAICLQAPKERLGEGVV